MGEIVSVFREEHFNAAHRLNNPTWTDSKNKEVFGKCNLPNYHGHNYVLIVKVTGEIDDNTGYLMDMKILSDIIKENVLDRFDHRNLNEDVPEFRELNPTAENIAIVIYRLIRPLISELLSVQIRLYETPRNFVEYPAQ
jgi:6-pyruvoyltetrahydropterin/6-carboxytetrahydropterin synthase